MEAMTINNEADDQLGIETFKHMLSKNKGKTMLEFQSLMTIFRLLQWNNSFESMRKRGLKRDDVIAQYLHAELDTMVRNEMAKDWTIRTGNDRRALASELVRAKAELAEFRLAGRELRFFKEKQDILTLAIRNSSQV